MKKLLILFAILAFIGCSSDDDSIALTQNVKVKLENQIYTNGSELISINENCQFLYIQMPLKEDYMLDMTLTEKGYLVEVSLRETSGEHAAYKLADYHPLADITIEDFTYDEATQYLYIKLKGDLRKVGDSTQTKSIEIEIEDKNTLSIPCENMLMSHKAHINNADFRNNINYVLSDDSAYKAVSLSDNGFALVLDSAQNLSDLPLNQPFAFDESGSKQIQLLEYTGTLSSSNYTTPPIIEEEWQKYNCRGEFILTERNFENGTYHTKGQYSFTAYHIDNGEIAYQITNGQFVF